MARDGYGNYNYSNANPSPQPNYDLYADRLNRGQNYANHSSAPTPQQTQYAQSRRGDTSHYVVSQHSQPAYNNAQSWYTAGTSESMGIESTQQAAGTLSTLASASGNPTRASQSSTHSYGQYGSTSYPADVQYTADRQQPAPNHAQYPAQPHTREASYGSGNSSNHVQTQYQKKQQESSRATIPPQSISPAVIEVSRHVQNMQHGHQQYNQHSQSTIVDSSQVYEMSTRYKRAAEVEMAAANAQEASMAATAARLNTKSGEADVSQSKGEVNLENPEARRYKPEKKNRKKPVARKGRMAKNTPEIIDLTSTIASIPAPTSQEVTEDPEEPEVAIRAMMAKIREINSKHPLLVAKIWEQERQSHISSSKSPASAAERTPNTPSTSSPKPPVSKPKSRPTPQMVPPKSAASPARGLVTPLIAETTGDTIWPAEKKEKICQAATQFLNELPSNQSTPISKETFLHILNGNPTYIELCETLEGIGLQFDRGVFANMLLKALPYINSQQQANVGRRVIDLNSDPGLIETSLEAPVASPKSSSHTTAASPLREPSRANIGVWKGVNETDSLIPPPPIRPQLSGQRAEISSLPGTAPYEPKNKADAARKRNLSELVDLTGFSDDDIPPPPPPVKRQSAFQPQPLPSTRNPSYTFSGRSPSPVAVPPPQPIALPPGMGEIQARYSALLEAKCRNARLVEPLDRSKVMRRSKYNVTTLARDILLATGKHPDFAPLNSHLDILKTTIGRLGAHGYRISNDADLSSIKWDILDPGEPTHQVVPSSAIADAVMTDAPAFRDYASDGDDESDHNSYQRPLGRQSITVEGAPTSTSGQYLNSGNVKMVKKRSRPPGRPRLSDSMAFRRHGEQPDGRAAQSSAGRVVVSIPQSKPEAGTGYAALRAAQEASGTPLVKKRGRPVGWRKDIHMKGRPSTPSGGGSKKRNESVEKPQPVKYDEFKCKWENCTARLHNLETLRKHVKKNHGTAEPNVTLPFGCQWEGCGKILKRLDESTGAIVHEHQFFNFMTFEEWLNHIEQSHIGPISWAQGDGPRDGFSDGHDSEISDAYLSDRQGRQVTPRARVPPNYAGMSYENALEIARAAAAKPKKRVAEDMALEREAARLRNKDREGP